MKVYRLVLVLTAALLTFPGIAFSDSTTPCTNVLSEWGLIVQEDLVTSVEVQASALIGGNLTGTSNYSTSLVSASNGAGLVVGGDIVAGTANLNGRSNIFFHNQNCFIRAIVSVN